MADTDQVLNLTAIIRKVDGNPSKGAAALAESILDHPRFRAALADEPPEPIPPAALPEGYIDPEHSGDDRALLQTFYSACQAEGGTADEVTLRGLRAVLARWHLGLPVSDEPAVPQGREPAAVTGQLSDEELLKLAQQYSVVYLLSDGSACHPFQEGYDMRNDVLNFARAVLARWGTSNLTQTWRSPADGEVAELVAEIRHFLAGYQQMRGLDPEHICSIHRGDKMEAHITVSRLTRAAELLERQALAPVPVSERPWEREGWCDAEGRRWWGTPGFVNSYTVAQSAQWRLSTPDDRFGSELLCLPAHALPLPEVGE